MFLEKSRQGYVLVCERTRTGYSAHVPDLPGCVATGRTLAQMLRLMDGGIEMHLRGTREDGLKVQRPRTVETLRRKGLVMDRPMYRTERKALEDIFRELVPCGDSENAPKGER
jgi:predicted RNase H-like HicB family nuclease